MQAKNNDGTYGEILPYTPEGLTAEMAKLNVQHVEVFEGSKENIRKRTMLLGVKKRYQKCPKK